MTDRQRQNMQAQIDRLQDPPWVTSYTQKKDEKELGEIRQTHREREKEIDKKIEEKSVKKAKIRPKSRNSQAIRLWGRGGVVVWWWCVGCLPVKFW
jgi:hypothetical protein